MDNQEIDYKKKLEELAEERKKGSTRNIWVKR